LQSSDSDVTSAGNSYSKKDSRFNHTNEQFFAQTAARRLMVGSGGVRLTAARRLISVGGGVRNSAARRHRRGAGLYTGNAKWRPPDRK
jgi:hypothetical protein